MTGAPVWAPSVGVGSFLTIEMGRARTNSLGGSQGECHLWVYGASWEILDGTTIVTSSADDRETMIDGARVLEGESVQGFSFDREDLTLNLRLSAYVLAVSPLGDPKMEEWMLYLDDGTVVTAGPGKSLVHESAFNPTWTP